MRQLYKFGAYRVDPAKRLLLRDDQLVPLNSKAFETLLVLVQNSKRTVSKDDLLRTLWPDSFVEESNLTQNIFVLRKALGETAQDHRYIVTVPGKGYQFAERVRVVAEEEEAELVVKSRSRSTVVIEEDESFPDARAEATVPSSAKRKRLRMWVLACTAAPVILVAYWLRPPYPPPKVLRIVRLTNTGHVTPNQTLVTDGPRIYYRELINSQRATRSVSVEGGESAAVTQPFPWMDIEDISPNGTSLLVAEFSEEMTEKESLTPWIVPLLSGSPRQLTKSKGRDFGWSRFGRGFAISRDDGLYVMNSENDQQRRLVSLPGVPFTPRWSPDGRTIRFNLAYENKNDVELWEVRSNGHNPHPVLPGWNAPAWEWGGNWTPDGKYFIFHATRAGSTDIWAVRESADIFHHLDHKPVQLTAGPLTFVRPIPSRDGAKIFAVGVQPRGQLLRYDTKSKQLVSFLGGISADELHFSKDGQWVAYISFPERTLWRCRADGSEKRQLTFAPMRAYSPRWSPDGSRIVFDSIAAPGAPAKVALIGRDGGGLEIRFSANDLGAGPSWSPDGTSLAFSTYANADASRSAKDPIEVLNLKSGETKTVPESWGLYFPAWSPDGRYLAAVTVEGHRLMLFDWTTRIWRELTREYVDYPEWSPDSRYIYVNSLMYRNPRIFRFRIPNGKAEEVLHSEGPFIGVYGWWTGPTPDGSLLLLRDVSMVDLYSLDMRWP